MTSATEQLFGEQNRFSAFLKSTDQKTNIAECMARVFNALGELVSSKKPILMDVGCGEGELTVPVYQKLLDHNSNTKLIAIDPSQTMTNALTVRLEHEELQGSVLTEKVFDPDDLHAPPSRIMASMGDIVLCSHVIYYARNTDVATCDIFSLVKDDGILVAVHQSKNSQMHQLRDEFSEASERHPSDNQPITSDHMEAKLAEITGLSSVVQHEFTSNLYFDPSTPKIILDLINLLEVDFDEQRVGMVNIVEKYGDVAVKTRNVLEFILRADLFEQPSVIVKPYLQKVCDLLDKNPKADNGDLRIIISESISLTSRSPVVQERLASLSL